MLEIVMAIGSFRRPRAVEMAFEARSEEEDEVALLLLHGELDMAAVPLLEQEWRRVEERGKQVVALDLAGLTFIDASGLDALLCGLPLVGASGSVRKVFDLTGYGDLLGHDA
jgi:anti-anti-sigma factor